MPLPLEIVFQNLAPSPAIEAEVRKRARKLDRFHDRIMGCRVVVEAPHKHQHSGRLYRVAVDVTVPGGELIANRSPDQDHALEDVNVAIRDAFDAVRRQLEDLARRRRGSVKRRGDAAGGPIH
jgi:ribosome-associated translation inhibitor RaiA